MARATSGACAAGSQANRGWTRGMITDLREITVALVLSLGTAFGAGCFIILINLVFAAAVIAMAALALSWVL